VAAGCGSPGHGNVRGSIFLLRADLISPHGNEQFFKRLHERCCSVGAARLSEQITRSQRTEAVASPILRVSRAAKRLDVPLPQQALESFNGLGGFADKGREFVTVLGEGLRTPAPWVNVIANPSFGFLVSESGSGHTWSLNSRENQLTPWSNDPVIDPPGEASTSAMKETGEVWSPTALPIRDEAAPYIARHGQGYSRFHHGSHGILLELLQFVPSKDPIKISRLTLRNDSDRMRRLSVTAYAEWVAGHSRGASAPYIITEIDSQSGALFAQSAWGGEFGGRIAFADLAGNRHLSLATARNFLGATARSRVPRHWNEAVHFLERWEQVSIRARRYKPRLNCAPANALRSCFSWAKGKTESKVRESLAVSQPAELERNPGDVTGRWDDVLSTVQTPHRSSHGYAHEIAG